MCLLCFLMSSWDVSMGRNARKNNPRHSWIISILVNPKVIRAFLFFLIYLVFWTCLCVLIFVGLIYRLCNGYILKQTVQWLQWQCIWSNGLQHTGLLRPAILFVHMHEFPKIFTFWKSNLSSVALWRLWGLSCDAGLYIMLISRHVIILDIEGDLFSLGGDEN